jgi:uncharacterized protein YdhG (YjbR/CyaY superfamily)
MKKASPNKTPARTTDEYLARVPEDARAALENLRKVIRSAAPDAEELISYQMPAFKYHGRPLVCFAAFADHCSFFPMSSTLLDTLTSELKGRRAAKGTIHFTPVKPLPAALVRKIVKARMRETDSRKKA